MPQAFRPERRSRKLHIRSAAGGSRTAGSCIGGSQPSKAGSQPPKAESRKQEKLSVKSLSAQQQFSREAGSPAFYCRKRK